MAIFANVREAGDVTSNWSPESWRNFSAGQQPDWPDSGQLEAVAKSLSTLPPLVFAGEARNLQEQLGRVANGEAFLLQAGDCAESFDDCTADVIRDKLKVILQMAIVLTYSTGVPVVKVGRIAGQFAKPRSSATETIEGVELPSFRGHIVNDVAFSGDARNPDANRLLQAYNSASATLNLLRAFTRGGFADLYQVHAWNQEFVAASDAGKRYTDLADEIGRALRFLAAIGVDSDMSAIGEVDFYTSHEALVLDYEQALTRKDSLTGDWYDCSAHLLWIGERTRELDGAHVEFLRGVGNPLGCKLGPTATPGEAIALCEALNPDQIPGRLTFITRMGADKISEGLPPLLEAVKAAGHPVVWVSDPMHGNTYSAPNGRKTRHLEDILREINGFFEAHHAVGTWPGGIHVELTGDDVTECLGGTTEIGDDDLERRYETMCDPRLNGRQGLDLAFRVADLVTK